MPGTVYIMGAGPGDPDLLTLKAYRHLQQAEVVIYDRLVSNGVMALVPGAAEKIYVGKQKERHTLPQEEINELLVAQAHRHQHVVRLKGGDPFIFGRGSEEAEALTQAGIAFEVIPGITAASGCASYAGIPLTHRALASSVRFVTGHARKDAPLTLNWASLADPDTTLVIYMGLTHAETIARELIAHGLTPDTPAAAVTDGTLPNQRTTVTNLQHLPADIARYQIAPPATLIIGRVVQYADILRWSWSI